MQHSSMGVDKGVVSVTGIHSILQLAGSSRHFPSHQQTLHRLLQHMSPQYSKHSTGLQGGGVWGGGGGAAGEGVDGSHEKLTYSAPGQ